MSRKEANVTVKLIALLLAIGGIAGVVICGWTCIKLAFYQSQPIFSLAICLLVVFAIIFALCIWTGVDLWRGRPRALNWARVLFALQIPAITIPGFAYQFYTGMLLLAYWNNGEGKLGADFELASSFTFTISSRIEDSIFGVNLIALAALICLLCVSSKTTQQSPVTAQSAVGSDQSS
ncbi:MAG TPA: hypothetical protein VFK06_06990 [Candidatus Angelobacter sp.]|nr:hypothetical protein [Candidatus Angelobacter sp.]